MERRGVDRAGMSPARPCVVCVTSGEPAASTAPEVNQMMSNSNLCPGGRHERPCFGNTVYGSARFGAITRQP